MIFEAFSFTEMSLNFCKLSTGHKKIIEILIEKGANVNAVDNNKMTPLHYIASYDHRPNRVNWTEDDRLSNFRFILSHFSPKLNFILEF